MYLENSVFISDCMIIVFIFECYYSCTGKEKCIFVISLQTKQFFF